MWGLTSRSNAYIGCEGHHCEGLRSAPDLQKQHMGVFVVLYQTVAAATGIRSSDLGINSRTSKATEKGPTTTATATTTRIAATNAATTTATSVAVITTNNVTVFPVYSYAPLIRRLLI